MRSGATGGKRESERGSTNQPDGGADAYDKGKAESLSFPRCRSERRRAGMFRWETCRRKAKYVESCTRIVDVRANPFRQSKSWPLTRNAQQGLGNKTDNVRRWTMPDRASSAKQHRILVPQCTDDAKGEVYVNLLFSLADDWAPE